LLFEERKNMQSFYTFEGPNLICDLVVKKIYKVILMSNLNDVLYCYKFPGSIYSSISVLKKSLCAIADLHLMCADLSEFTDKSLVPALRKENSVIILNRYIDYIFATYHIKNISYDIINNYVYTASKGCVPNLTFFLDMNIKDMNFFDVTTNFISENEMNITITDNMIKEDMTLYEEEKKVLLKRAQKDPSRFRVIEVSHSLDGMIENIYNEIKNDMCRRKN